MSPTEQANIATVEEASEICDVNIHTMRTAIQRGVLPSRKVDGRRPVDLEEVEAWKATKRRGRPTCNDYERAPELAKERGIKRASAKKAIYRWNT